MKAFSTDTGREYDTWDQLVAAESNGYVVVAMINNGKQQWPWVEGPFARKHEANLCRARLRYALKRDARGRPGFSFKLFIRPAWKKVDHAASSSH